MKLKTVAAAVVLVLALQALPALAKIYGNARFGFFIDVPAAFGVADPEPENGDGQSFHTKDSTAMLSASGGWIVEDDFAAQVSLFKKLEREDGWTISYESTVGKSSASYSGTKANRIFYRHIITSCQGKAQASYWLEYPAADKAKYDVMIKSLNVSLKPGVGPCG